MDILFVRISTNEQADLISNFPFVMTPAEQRIAAKNFAAYWKGKGYEKGETQAFWLALLRDVFGVKEPEKFIFFESQIQLSHTGFIDGFIPATHVLIEQKSLDKDPQKPIRQSDGTLLTPFQQAKRYAAELPYSARPRWIVVSNFAEFHVYDLEHPTGEAQVILLQNLEQEFYRLSFLADSEDVHLKKELEVSIKAGELVGVLYDEILKQYRDPQNEFSLKSLNKLCVRLVFCLYAEDAGIFGKHGAFHDYLKDVSPQNARKAIIELFKILNTRPEDRDPYLSQDLLQFPYVNGGLFAEENIEIPNFTQKILDLLLQNASEDFDWSEISPTIFGAVFESTLNPETRRSGGMHYTSPENIHKVIDPLFLDALHEEFELLSATPSSSAKAKKKLFDFQEKLASLTFFDPACGSGNFLTETYLSLRRLENKVLSLLSADGNAAFLNLSGEIVKVSIRQFYGIEINDFAVTVAKTALWIAESQMLKETEEIVKADLDFLPLKTYANIVEGNALRLDWESVIPKAKLHYIMGNPPFVGYSLQSKEQKADMLSIYVDEKGKPYKTAGKIDYVSGWYWKASELMAGTPIRTALVSTNSITQGEQVAAVWKPLYERFGIRIDFAHRTFRWDSEANDKAHVHCVIVGFSTAENNRPKHIFDGNEISVAQNISPYLIDAPNIFVESRGKPLCSVPEMTTGNRPADGGCLIVEKEDYSAFLESDASAGKFLKKLVGSAEFINNKERWCIWLKGISPAEWRKSPAIMKRVEACRQNRLDAPDPGRQKLAATPFLFRETLNPESFIIVPGVSSERRRYIPLGFEGKDTIPTNLVLIIPEATIYHFGILTSSVHMAWMRTVCGRLKSDYRYSKDIVYNNFPWCEPSETQKAKIEQTAQAILDARALYPDCSLADLYDETTMPPELRKAHQANDRAVMDAYGFKSSMPEPEIVARLMERYLTLSAPSR